MINADERPAVLDLALTRLSAADRDAYTAIIDDILAEYGAEVISSDDILDMLREKVSLALTRQRHHIRLLIIERLRMQLIPQTVALIPGADHDTASSMAAAVFNVQELLESVLFHLPVVDLVRSRRVNKNLHRVIEISPKLQRKLFLLPTNNSLKYWSWASKENTNDKLVVSPHRPPSASSSSREKSNIVAVLNPLVQADDWDFKSSPDETQTMVVVHSTKIDKRILTAQARWPEMYLTSPPCTEIRIDFSYCEVSDKIHNQRLQVKREVYDPAGVTFASIWDALHERNLITVWGGYEPWSEDSGQSELEESTVHEVIDHHRRRGINVVLDAEHCSVRSYSVTLPVRMLRYDTDPENGERRLRTG